MAPWAVRNKVMGSNMDPQKHNEGSMSWGHAIAAALGWQLVPTGLLMFGGWDSPSRGMLVFRIAVLLVLPVLAGVILHSWKVGIVCALLPVFAIGMMKTVFMLIMPNGKW